MSSKKKAYLQQFGIIHLPNPDLTYIRNPERETKLYLCPSTSWKLKSGTLLCYLFLFSPSHLTRNHDANRAPRAYIYALEAGFSQVAKNCQVFCQTVGGVFLTFLPKIKDGNSICQTAGDDYQTVTCTCSIIRGKYLLFERDYCRRLLSLPFPESNQIEYNSLEKLLINGRCTIAFTIW